MSQNTPPSSGNWYTADPSCGGASAWYQAASAEKTPSAPNPPLNRPATERQQRRRSRTKAVSLSVCGVLVCAAVVVAVLYSDLGQRLRGALDRSAESAEVYDFDFGSDALPDIGLPEKEYEDFRDYFEHYYVGSGEIELPAAPTGTGVKLRLEPGQDDELSLQEIYERVSPAVVGVTTVRSESSYAWGTGVVFTADGYVITNTHLLVGCSEARVLFPDGQEYPASLVGADEASDIAVLYIGGKDLPYARFGQSEDLRVGDTAVAIGNPLSQAYTGTMTDGIISAIDRNVSYLGHKMTLLQTNAALNEGNSGGPLINAAGQVVGITNMKVMSSYATTVEGIGFAIPSAVVKQIVDQLLEKGMVSGEPSIGIVAGSVGWEAMELYDLPNGVYVSQVTEGSDAQAKGLREGDVITAVNGVNVSTVAQVNALKEELQVGDSLTLTVYRDGESFDLEIELVDLAELPG